VNLLRQNKLTKAVREKTNSKYTTMGIRMLIMKELFKTIQVELSQLIVEALQTLLLIQRVRLKHQTTLQSKR
jgi:hypothetical protein